MKNSLTLLIFISYALNHQHTILASQTPQNIFLLDRVEDFIKNSENIPSQRSNQKNKPRFDPSLLLVHQGTQEAKPDQSSSEGTQPIFPNGFKVYTPDNQPDPLANIERRTYKMEQGQKSNPQEQRLMNKEFEKKEEIEKPTATERNPYQFGPPTFEPGQTSETPTEITNEPTVVDQEVGPKTITVTRQDENIYFADEDLEPETRTSDHVNLYTTLLCIILCFILIIILFFQQLISQYFNPILLKRITSVSRDVIIIMVIITFTLWLNFEGAEILVLNINGIALYFLIFGLSWLFTSLIIVIAAQAFSVNWEEKEILLREKDEILRTYCELYQSLQNNQELTKGELKVFHHNQAIIDYFLLRQNFIAPSYLAYLTEHFLRDDFNFAEYLTLALGKTLENLFQVSLATILTLLFVIFYWATISTIKSFLIESIIFGILIPVGTVIMLILRKKFINIFSLLKIPIEDPHTIQFLNAETQKDPWVNLQNPLPQYVNSSFNSVLQPKEFFSGQKRANLQERLFWLCSPQFSIKIIHSLIVFQIAWGIIFFGYYVPDSDLAFIVVFSILFGIVIVANLCILVPSSICRYAIITNIEMMKDKELIQKTISNQRDTLRLALLKLYRLLKSARREFIDIEEDRPTIRLKDFIFKTIKSAFKQINPNNWDIELHDLPTVTRLCGAKLEKDELVYFAREASTDLETINIESFIETVEKTTQDVKLDPYYTSLSFFKSYVSGNGDFLTLKEFNDLLRNHRVLPNEDIDEILHEMKYYTPNKSDIDIGTVSALIRNMIEEHAR